MSEELEFSIPQDHQEYCHRLAAELMDLRSKAGECMGKMNRVDEKRLTCHELLEFLIGQRVWLLCNYSKKGQSKKLLWTWHGP